MRSWKSFPAKCARSRRCPRSTTTSSRSASLPRESPPPAELKKYLDEEITTWGKLVEQIGLAGSLLMADLKIIAERLMAAQDGATTLPPITADAPDFSVADGYAVLHDIETRRRAQGWRAVGRKIGFTNRTIWPRYGVYQPMWAHVWSHTVHFATDGKASLDLKPLRAAADRTGGRVQAERSGAAD